MVDWTVVDGAWDSKGRMDAEMAVWYLLGVHKPSKDSKLFLDRSGDAAALNATLKQAGAIETKEIFHCDLPTAEIIRHLPRSQYPEFWRDVELAHKSKLIAFYEKNPAMGRPPFIFEDARIDEKEGAGTAKRKAPDAFVAALIVAISEIAWRAGKAGTPFGSKDMPGVKSDLQELFRKFNPPLYGSESTPRTFDDYLSGLCQFKRGAKSSDFYRKLFPELFENT